MNQSFHEAAHAVLAVRLGMLDVGARLGAGLSETGVPTDADAVNTFYLFPGEIPTRMLQRRLIVALAGPVWEVFSDPMLRPASYHLAMQKVDRAKAKQIVREVRKHCGLRRSNLKVWERHAWDEASRLVIQENHNIILVAEELEKSGKIEDSGIRALMGSNSQVQTLAP